MRRDRRFVQSGLGEQQHIVGDVQHAFAMRLQILERLRSGKGPKQDPPALEHARPHGEVQTTVDIERSDQTFENGVHVVMIC